MNDQPPIGVIIIILVSALFGTGVLMGSRIGDSENYEAGRNAGIIFCTEKPKECKIKYDYTKLGETK